MATVTTILLAGDSHPNHGGIIPAHQLMLWENDRPSWILTSLEQGNKSTQPIRWTPTLERMEEDAIVMLYLYAADSKSVQSVADQVLQTDWRNGDVELNRHTDEAGRMALYEACRMDETIGATVMVSLLNGSESRWVETLNAYPRWNATVCVAKHTREYNRWQNRMDITGELLPSD